VHRERVIKARAKAVADAREMRFIGSVSAFDYEANGQLRASKGAGYVAKARERDRECDQRRPDVEERR
jgi:hypothetical protein